MCIHPTIYLERERRFGRKIIIMITIITIPPNTHTHTHTRIDKMMTMMMDALPFSRLCMGVCAVCERETRERER